MDKQYRGIVMPLNISMLGREVFVGMQLLNNEERTIYFLKGIEGENVTLITESIHGSKEVKTRKRNLKFIGIVFLDGKEKNSMAPLKHSQWAKCLETLEDADNRVVIVSLIGDKTNFTDDRVFKTYSDAYCKILAAPTKKFRELG